MEWFLFFCSAKCYRFLYSVFSTGFPLRLVRHGSPLFYPHLDMVSLFPYHMPQQVADVFLDLVFRMGPPFQAPSLTQGAQGYVQETCDIN